MTRTRSTITAASNLASQGFFRHQRASRSAVVALPARIGLSSRNRCKSSARDAAVWYRSAGSRAMAFSMIVSRSCGTDGELDFNGGGGVAQDFLHERVPVGGLVRLPSATSS